MTSGDLAPDANRSNVQALTLEYKHPAVDQSDVQFAGDGGVPLSAWFYLPTDREGPLPAITMAHGFGATRWHGMAAFAEAFAAAGFAVLLHDHWNFGASG